MKKKNLVMSDLHLQKTHAVLRAFVSLGAVLKTLHQEYSYHKIPQFYPSDKPVKQSVIRS